MTKSVWLEAGTKYTPSEALAAWFNEYKDRRSELRGLTAATEVQMLLGTLNEAGYSTSNPRSVLDLGCGAGNLVDALQDLGYDSFGCDVDLDIETERLKRCTLAPYRIPFPDGRFDLVFTTQVFEHVMDMKSVLREMRRVMKPEAVSLHLYPDRWRLTEGHVCVPLAPLCGKKAWLRFWAIMGIRNIYQKDMDASKVADLNHEYLEHFTNYPSDHAMKRLFRDNFGVVRPAEKDMFRYFASKGNWKGKVAIWAPMASWLYRRLYSKIVILAR